MVTRLIAIVLVLGFACRGESQQVDAKKLSEFIRTPNVSLMLGVGFNTQRGFVLAGESIDYSAKIVALEKALCGDGTDAERYYQLSDYYDDEDKSKEAAAKAAALFKKQLALDPRNGRLAMRLGQCLRDDDDEVEKLLRRAVELAPRDAECWETLGDHLWGKSFEALVNSPGKKTAASQMEIMMKLFTRSIPEENLRASRKIAREATECMDRAVAAAPRQSKYYMGRAITRTFYVVLEEVSRPAPADQNDFVDSAIRLIGQLAKSKAFADIQKAAELEPNDPRALVVAAFVEATPHLGELLAKAKTGDDAAKERALKKFASQGMRIADKLVAKLEKLTKHQDKQTAAEACYFQSLIFTVKAKAAEDPKTVNAAEMARTKELLLRSVKLAPSNQNAWDLLLMVLATEEKTDKQLLISVCESRLRVKDDARNRYWAAKSLVQLDLFAEAEKHLRAGIAHDANSTINHVGLAAVLLRRGNPLRQNEAIEHLDKADKLLEQNNDANLAEDIAVLRAAHAALTGDPAAARRMLRAVLEKNSKNETAESMLQVVGD